MKPGFHFRRTAKAGAIPRWPSLCAGLFLCQLAGLPGGLFAQPDPCSLAWHRILPANSPNSPGLLTFEAMAYDSQRHVAVLFGGIADIANSSDTWEWDGATWVKRTTGQPSARATSAMAYDSNRGVCILFGGAADFYQGATPFNDTWEWNGSTWSLRSGNDPAAKDRPPPMNSPMLAYDSARKRTVLVGPDYNYGGSSYGPLTQTWEWDGTNWYALAAAPPSRAEATMAYDPVLAVTVLFGGISYNSTNDTWTWDGTTWTKIAAAVAPPPRSEASMAFDVRRGVMVLFGGEGDDVASEYNDTWEWSGGSWTLDPYSNRFGLIPRRLCHMWYDTGDQKLVVFGGMYGIHNPDGSFSYTVLDDMWEARPPGFWVDFNYTGQTETGDYYTPYKTLGAAVNAAPNGCALNLKTGSDAETLSISKPLQLLPYNGPVTVGH